MTSEIKAQHFYQLVSLLIDNGSIVLRELFKKHALAQAVSLDMYLFNHRTTLDDLHNKKRVLTPKQMDLLFPSNGSADITTFDITLLSSLFKNIGESLPHQEKQDIEELKKYRNEVSAHATKAAVDETDFNLLWQKISPLITNLSQFSGDPSFIQKVKDDIEDLRKCPKLKPSSYNTNLLLEWCNKDHEVAQLLYRHHAALTASLDKLEVSNAEMKAAVQNSFTPWTDNSLCETCMYIQGETTTEERSKEQNSDLQRNTDNSVYKGSDVEAIDDYDPVCAGSDAGTIEHQEVDEGSVCAGSDMPAGVSQPERKEKPFAKRKVIFEKDINVRTPEEAANNAISGSCFLPNFTLLLTDPQTKQLKVFNKNFEINQTIPFKERPRRVACYDNSEIAVSTRGSNIARFSMQGQTLTEIGTTSVRFDCFGIDYISHDRLAVTGNERPGFFAGLKSNKGPGFFCVLTMDGSELSRKCTND